MLLWVVPHSSFCDLFFASLQFIYYVRMSECPNFLWHSFVCAKRKSKRENFHLSNDSWCDLWIFGSRTMIYIESQDRYWPCILWAEWLEENSYVFLLTLAQFVCHSEKEKNWIAEVVEFIRRYMKWHRWELAFDLSHQNRTFRQPQLQTSVIHIASNHPTPNKMSANFYLRNACRHRSQYLLRSCSAFFFFFCATFANKKDLKSNVSFLMRKCLFMAF